MTKDIQGVFRELVHSVNDSAIGPNACLFAGVLGYLTQAEQEYMIGVSLRDAPADEGLARAMFLHYFEEELGKNCGVVLVLVSDVFRKHLTTIEENYEEIGRRLLSKGFEDNARASLVRNLAVAETVLAKTPTIFFNIPPIEA